MKLRYILLMAIATSISAQAEIYKSIDKDGHVTYSSEPIKGGKRLNLGPLPTMMPPAKPSAPSPTSFPKVDSKTQQNRDDMRRKILQDELDSEEKLLTEAKRNLEETSPEVFRGKDGKTYRNITKYEEKTRLLTEEIELHENNVTALKTELSKLK